MKMGTLGPVNTGTAGVPPAMSVANNVFATCFLAVSRQVIMAGWEVPMLGALENGLFATLSAGGTPAVPVMEKLWLIRSKKEVRNQRRKFWGVK